MHPAQRRAIVAMINSMETQLSAVKGLIVSDFDEVPQPPRPQTTPSGGSYLSDAEEARLEAELEAERQQSLKAYGDAFQRLEKIGDVDG